MFKVMMECRDNCPDWEDLRETLRTDDPVEAIRRSGMHRDLEHISWVERVS